MSLDDLSIRAATKPILAELDRQKEKCARMKQERDEALSMLAEVLASMEPGVSLGGDCIALRAHYLIAKARP